MGLLKTKMQINSFLFHSNVDTIIELCNLSKCCCI